MGGEWKAQYRIYIERDEDGMFTVTCPALPGCVSQGASREEAIANIREAIELYLESLRWSLSRSSLTAAQPRPRLAHGCADASPFQ